jgi:hypothetical protein
MAFRRTINKLIHNWTLEAEEKINHYQINEIEPIITDSQVENFRLNAIGIDGCFDLDQVIDFLANFYILSHGGELELDFTSKKGILIVNIVYGDVEPSNICREHAKNKAMHLIRNEGQNAR